MQYRVLDPAVWTVLGSVVAYRTIPNGATYEPDEAFPSDGGRFDNGNHPTLYLSLSPQGAIAEFFRGRPELLSFKNLKINLFRVTVELEREGVDIRTPQQSAAIGFPHDRLTSSERNALKRYAECRVLVEDVIKADGIDIAYPSAALPGSNNTVILGYAAPGRWSSRGFTPEAVPVPDTTLIRHTGP